MQHIPYIPPTPPTPRPRRKKEEEEKERERGKGSAEAPGTAPGIPHGPGFFYTIYI